MLGRAQVDAIAVREDFPLGGFRVMVMLIACCFLAPLFRVLPSEHARHVFSIAAGLYAGVFVFDYAILHMLGWSVGVYLLLMVLPPKSAARRVVGRIVLVAMLAYVAGVHYYREYFAPDIVWDAAQMLLTLKMTSFVLNYSDGYYPKDKLKPAMAAKALPTLPGFVPFMSFCFFFPTFLAGPVFEFKDYMDWMKEARVAPWRVHLRNLFVFLISSVGYFVSLRFPAHEIDSPTFYPDKCWIERILRMCVNIALFRFRYYMLWSLAEAASAVAGVGYVAETGKWNGITNDDILCVEIPTSARVCINNWNIGVARWLNTYIYQRVGLSREGKPGLLSTMSSFFVSAWWHGLSPGYYLFFITCGVYIEVGKHFRRRLRPYFHYTEDRAMYPHAIFFSYGKGRSHPLAIVYDIVGTFVAWIAMQYAGIAFEILDVRRALRIWASWYFLPHIISVALLAFFIMFPQRRPKSNEDSKKSR